MLIKEINPIDKSGVSLLNDRDAETLIDEIIELPLRNACKIFKKKGIETLMSSANKNNVLEAGEKVIEKEDVYGSGQQYSKLRPTYEDTGKGYAWIMLNFDTLSEENKDWLFALESKKGKNGEPIGEKAIWFVHPCEISNLEYKIKVGHYDYHFLKTVLPENQIPQGIEFDERLAEFEKRHIVLAYHWGMYSLQSVFLRMPINEQTTVEEVDEYFSKLAKGFKEQNKESDVNDSFKKSNGKRDVDNDWYQE